MGKIRILLIEDNRLLREGIASLLEEQGDFEVIARSEDGDTVLQLKSRKRDPDVVLLDLGLHKESSLHLMRLLKREIPGTKVIAMDILPEHVDMVEFVKEGGSGFILKDASLDDFLKTIRSVARGEKVLPSVLTKSLFTQIAEYAFRTDPAEANKWVQLTYREREIVDLISEGLSNKEIAQRLHIATYTVKSHVHNILEKLALSTRLEIAALAHTEGTDRPLDDRPPANE